MEDRISRRVYMSGTLAPADARDLQDAASAGGAEGCIDGCLRLVHLYRAPLKTGTGEPMTKAKYRKLLGRIAVLQFEYNVKLGAIGKRCRPSLSSAQMTLALRRTTEPPGRLESIEAAVTALEFENGVHEPQEPR